MLRGACRSLHNAISVRAATSKAHPFTRVPLNVVLPGFEKTDSVASSAAVEADLRRDPFDAELTTLENGLKVASQPSHGDFVTIGVAIESGCRYEAEHRKGIAHFLEKLAFNSTPRRSSDEIFAALDKSSAIIDCQSTRDTTIFAASCHRSGVDEILEIIADAALRPSLLEEEIDAARQTIVHENDEMRLRIENEPLMTDWLHQAAFRHNSVGFSKFTTDENAEKTTREELVRFQRAHHNPARMTVSGVGISHSDLVGLSQRFFVENSESLPARMPSIDTSTAQYTGGEIRESADLSKVGAGTPYPLLAHVSLGFEGVGYKDEDFVTFCVLQSLLGGGNSFSAGGPGKGMYSRCYVDVLNHHHWMYGCQAFNHSYKDAGVFAVTASAPMEGLWFALQCILDLIVKLPKGTEQQELNRAKTQLKSQLLMNLEVRPVMFEDMARQVMGHGYRRKPWEYIQAIDNVTNEDIIRVGDRLLSSRPTLVGYGDLTHLPTYSDLDEAVARRDATLLDPRKKKKIFSFQ